VKYSMEQPTLPGHEFSLFVLGACGLFFCPIHCDLSITVCRLILFLFTIVLSVVCQFTLFYYAFCIFKLFNVVYGLLDKVQLTVLSIHHVIIYIDRRQQYLDNNINNGMKQTDVFSWILTSVYDSSWTYTPLYKQLHAHIIHSCCHY
jgi:hypothetical protein